jgi:hypothetical protein
MYLDAEMVQLTQEKNVMSHDYLVELEKLVILHLVNVIMFLDVAMEHRIQERNVMNLDCFVQVDKFVPQLPVNVAMCLSVAMEYKIQERNAMMETKIIMMRVITIVKSKI